MKYLLFPTALMVGANRSGIAQTTATPPSTSQLGLYKWNAVVLMQPATDSGTLAGDGANNKPKVLSEVGQKFRVINVDKGLALIIILDYTSSTKETNAGKKTTKIVPLGNFYKYNFLGDSAAYSALSDADKKARNYGAKQAYFTVAAGYLSDLTVAVKQDRIGGALSAGVINFPFKYRPQKNLGDFSGAFNFGAGIGYKFPHPSAQAFTYSVLSGYSIANTVLDSSNTTSNQGKLASSNNYTSFSFSLGLLVEYQKVQAGVFFGWDRISRISQREFSWVYQGKPWISIGFGLAIFSSQAEKPSTSQTTQ